MNRKRSVFWTGAVLLCVGSVAQLGCGFGGLPAAKVTGQVLLAGQPVSNGSVLFYSVETGTSAGANLDTAGHFQFSDPLTPGTYRVSVMPPTPVEAGPTAATKPPVVTRIPQKFTSEITTPLTATVQPGENNFPLQLN